MMEGGRLQDHQIVEPILLFSRLDEIIKITLDEFYIKIIESNKIHNGEPG